MGYGEFTRAAARRSASAAARRRSHDASPPPSPHRATCTYDALHRRVLKKGLAIDGWHDYYYNSAWQVLEVRRDTTQGQQAPVLRHQYVWSVRYIDAPVLRDENKDADGDCTDGDDERLYFCNDVNMNVVALVNDSNEVVERYLYDPYGRTSVLHGVKDAQGTDTSDHKWKVRGTNTFQNQLGFCGYWYDFRSGFYHVRHRAYYPNRGWLQRDPLGYVDGMSLYEYVQSGPVVLVDPYGLGVYSAVLGDSWGGDALSVFQAVTTGNVGSIAGVGAGMLARWAAESPVGQSALNIAAAHVENPVQIAHTAQMAASAALSHVGLADPAYAARLDAYIDELGEGREINGGGPAELSLGPMQGLASIGYAIRSAPMRWTNQAVNRGIAGLGQLARLFMPSFGTLADLGRTIAELLRPDLAYLFDPPKLVVWKEPKDDTRGMYIEEPEWAHNLGVGGAKFGIDCLKDYLIAKAILLGIQGQGPASGRSTTKAPKNAPTPEYGATPKGRPFTKHYGTETGPQRNIPGSVIDNTIDTTSGTTVGGGKTVYYDPVNNVTVVTGDGVQSSAPTRGHHNGKPWHYGLPLDTSRRRFVKGRVCARIRRGYTQAPEDGTRFGIPWRCPWCRNHELDV